MKETKEIIAYAVTPDGEIMSELYSGDKIVREAQSSYPINNIIDFNKKEAFVKVFTSPIINLYKTLTTKESAVLLSIIPFISYSDGILRYNGKIITIKDICQILEENYDVYSRTIRSLINKNILAKSEVVSDTNTSKTKKCIVANPYIFMRGQDISKWTVDLFKKE